MGFRVRGVVASHISVLDDMWNVHIPEGQVFQENFHWGHFFEHIKSPEALLSYCIGTILLMGGCTMYQSLSTKPEQEIETREIKLILSSDHESIPKYLGYGFAFLLVITGLGLFTSTCRRAIIIGYTPEGMI